MAGPAKSIVERELNAVRRHLLSLVSDLSDAELIWLPPRPDGIAISYHFGHIGLVEDVHVAEATGTSPVASDRFRDAFGVHNVNNRDARFPAGGEIRSYLGDVRSRTSELLEKRYRDLRTEVSTSADLFRGIINHEYSHTKYIRRIRAEMGKAPVEVTLSALIRVDEHAIAAPQYSIPHW